MKSEPYGELNTRTPSAYMACTAARTPTAVLLSSRTSKVIGKGATGALAFTLQPRAPQQEAGCVPAGRARTCVNASSATTYARSAAK
ncbi:hypothetical protein EON67_03825 [archaeon]|nr:MAG: hypothetical protein EON67_03825 [archaeon]